MIFLTDRRASADLAIRCNVDSFTAADGKSGKAHAQEPRTDGLVKLTMEQLQASQSELSPCMGSGDSESGGECDETTALRDVDVSVVTAATTDTFVSTSSKGSSENSARISDVHSFVDQESKGTGSFAAKKVSNSCENLTQL